MKQVTFPSSATPRIIVERAAGAGVYRGRAPTGYRRTISPAKRSSREESDATAEARVPRRGGEVHPLVERLGAYSWRLVAIGVVAWAVIHILGALRVVVFPVVVATFLTAALAPVARRLKALGLPSLAATWIVFVSFLGSLWLVGALIVPPLASEFESLGPTVAEAAEDVETWLVEDSPFDVSRSGLEDLKEQFAGTLKGAAGSSGGLILDTAVLAFEVVAGLILALMMTFFFLKDGERFQRWALRRLPRQHHDAARRAATRFWRTIGGYLRGSAALGALEGTILAITLAVVGATLVVPVAVLTFMAAFIPFVGAIVAGVIAVAVTLATAGPVAALTVAIVALVVQQLDNDLLAPLVFGKALDLHPLIILVAVAAGATLAGISGAFIAVPLTAVIINVTDELANGAEASSDAARTGRT